MRKRYLTVIKNNEGFQEYDLGIESSDNMSVFELPENEFDSLYETGVFDDINNMCELLIDDFESEVIEKSDLKQCIEILKKAGMRKVFLTALLDAEAHGIALALDLKRINIVLRTVEEKLDSLE